MTFYKNPNQFNMGNKNTPGDKSRRWFLSLFLPEAEAGTGKTGSGSKPEMVKMLTADGKLVEVNKELLDKAQNRIKATRKDIFDWMDNPSKKNS
jgi:hypothetical protein